MTAETVIVEAWQAAMQRPDYPDLDLRDLAELFLEALVDAGYETAQIDGGAAT